VKDALRISKDRKISPGVSYASSGKSFRVLPNAFGLPAGPADSCPGATHACTDVCYAGRLELAYTSLHRMLAHNLRLLRACADDVPAMTELIVPLVADFLTAVTNWQRRHGRPVAKVFRIHWDGDFFSMPYAEAWREVVRRFPDVAFWTYTRSFTDRLDVVPTLYGLPNLTLYLSVDRNNQRDARRVLAKYPDVHVSVLAGTVAGGKVLYTALTGKSAIPCPEKVGKLPLVTSSGEGACVTCGLCVFGRKGVVFPAVRGALPATYPPERALQPPQVPPPPPPRSVDLTGGDRQPANEVDVVVLDLRERLRRRARL
jgi:hypothetical protein